MALFNWLRRLITPPQPRQRPERPYRSRPAARPTQRHDPSVEPPVTPPVVPTVETPPAPQPTPIQTHAQPDATLVVRLVDEANRPLQPALVLTGQLNAPVHLKLPQITGYTLLHINGFTQNFLSEYGLTTLVYRRQWGQPVITYLVDYDSGQLLALPQLFRGELTARFQITPPTVPGYHIFQAQGDQQGQYDRTSKRIVFFYRRDAWQTVQRVRQYVTLTADHAVYDEPAGQAYGYQFPAQSLWRLFAIITLTDGQVWYNLGGEQWLDARETDRHEHWSRTQQLPPKVTTWRTKTATHQVGRVDYVPQGALTIFREPYGEVAGQVQNGDLLEIRQRLVDDQNLVWYQVGPEAYINARYVRLIPQHTL
ncbi:MucBP domain-containing protein [Levilactobacillus spicheri]|uniref:MucBP domain-containing protein n=1 Tax=Levilactobacillus spicheri TaxID=216463 RepID=A0A0F3RQ45_9LACO|nr:MucBP domain-containing protein [Levilactobacillus spicheri]KJW11719.1 hypothetical protein VC81_13105 [Levilactobacillus spicheri]